MQIGVSTQLSDALDAFNAAVSRDWEPTVTEEDIATFPTEASPLTLPVKETRPSAPGKSVYVSEIDGVKVLVKCWPALRYDVILELGTVGSWTFFSRRGRFGRQGSTQHLTSWISVLAHTAWCWSRVGSKALP